MWSRQSIINWIVCGLLWGTFNDMFITSGHYMQWCEFEFHEKKLSWAGAHAACRLSNKSLVRINDDSQYSYLTSLLATSISKMAIGLVIEPTVWIGLHYDANTLLRWAGCDVFSAKLDNDVVGGAGPGCFMLDVRHSRYPTAECHEPKQFVCQADAFNAETCFALTQSIADMTYATQATYLSKTYSSDCYGVCTDECVGFKHDRISHKCSMMLRSIGGGSGNKGSFYLKGLLNVAYHVNVTATYQPNDVCSDDVIHVTSSSSEVIQSTTFVQTSSPCWMGNSVSSPHTGLMTSITVIDDVTHVVTPLLTTTEGQIDTRPTNTGVCSTSTPYLTTSSTCYCPCEVVTNTTITPKQLESKINEIKQTLSVSKKDLSSWKRKLVSTQDNRPSAQSIGYIGAGILGVIAATLVIMDLPRLFGDFKRFLNSVF